MGKPKKTKPRPTSEPGVYLDHKGTPMAALNRKGARWMKGLERAKQVPWRRITPKGATSHYVGGELKEPFRPEYMPAVRVKRRKKPSVSPAPARQSKAQSPAPDKVKQKPSALQRISGALSGQPTRQSGRGT